MLYNGMVICVIESKAPPGVYDLVWKTKLKDIKFKFITVYFME